MYIDARPPVAASRAETIIAAMQRMVNTPSPEALDAMRALFSEDIRFRDPGTVMNGRDEFLRSFEQFCTAESVGQKILRTAISHDSIFINWRFSMKSGAAFEGYAGHDTGDDAIEFDGVGMMLLNEQGVIIDYTDFWSVVPDAYKAALR
ncbi:MAG: nuclear transport factor 2 family protein [Sphingobium sp.]